MRFLIYGMQSSGASTLALLLAQKPQSAAFVDIWSMYVAPALEGPGDVLAKVVATTAFPLSLHQERFAPDRTILVLRHPLANYRSLVTKPYRHECGFVEEKFAVLDQVFADGRRFDAIIHYEDLVFDPYNVLDTVSDLGWTCDAGFLAFARQPADIAAFNETRFPVVRERLGYGFGNYRGGGITPAFAGWPKGAVDAAPVAAWCPHLTAHYRDLMGRRDRWWRKPAAGGTAAADSEPAIAAAVSAGIGEARATADRVRLDHYRRGEGYRHIDISIFALSVGGETWPLVKCKFCRGGRGLFLEFREATGWPRMFRRFPGSGRDDYGRVLRLSAEDVGAVAERCCESDRLLLKAVASLLPQAVAAALAGELSDTAEQDECRTEAAAFTEQCLAPGTADDSQRDADGR